MDSTKYVGMDVHKDTISIAVMNSAGKVVMESVLETKAVTILQFIQGLRGNLLVTLEEGTWAAWLYDLLKPHVTKVTVCNPRKNALLKSGNKSDRIDAQKLAELLRHGSLSAVYHGENGLRTLKELTRSYLTISKDLTRVMNRLKALYHSWGIACAGTQVYAPRHRLEWHSLRHTFSTLGGNEGSIPTLVMKQLLGHSRLSTTDRYMHELAGPKREAVQKIEKLILFPRKKASGE